MGSPDLCHIPTCSLTSLFLANTETPQWSLLCDTFMRPYAILNYWKGGTRMGKICYSSHIASRLFWIHSPEKKWCEAKLLSGSNQGQLRAPPWKNHSREALKTRRESSKADISTEKSPYRSSCDTGARCNKDSLQPKYHFVDCWPPVFFAFWKWFQLTFGCSLLLAFSFFLDFAKGLVNLSFYWIPGYFSRVLPGSESLWEFYNCGCFFFTNYIQKL